MRFKYKSLVFAAVAASSLLASGVHAQEELKIGVLAILSGPGQPWGLALSRATDMAIEDYNTKGFDVGGKRYQLKSVVYDSKYRPDEARTLANRLLLEDKVKYIMGPLGSAEVLAVQDMTNQNKVLTFILGFGRKFLGPSIPYQFRSAASDQEYAQPLITWASKRLDLKHVGGLFPNDEFGQQSSKQITEAYSKIGSGFTFELFERNKVDFVPLLIRLINQKIQAIDLDGIAPATAGLIVKQAREIGFKGPIIRSGGPAEEEILQIAGEKGAEGIYLYSPVNPDNPAVQAFNKRYEAKYSEKPNGFTIAFYDSARILLDSIQRTGKVEDSEAVMKTVASVKDFPGVQGPLKWTGKNVYGIDRQIDTPFYIVQLRGGKSVPVAKCSYSSCADMK